MPGPASESVSTAAAAATLNLSEQRVRQLARSGALSGTRSPEGTWRFDPADLERFRSGPPRKPGRPRATERSSSSSELSPREEALAAEVAGLREQLDRVRVLIVALSREAGSH